MPCCTEGGAGQRDGLETAVREPSCWCALSSNSNSNEKAKTIAPILTGSGSSSSSSYNQAPPTYLRLSDSGSSSSSVRTANTTLRSSSGEEGGRSGNSSAMRPSGSNTSPMRMSAKMMRKTGRGGSVGGKCVKTAGVRGRCGGGVGEVWGGDRGERGEERGERGGRGGGGLKGEGHAAMWEISAVGEVRTGEHTRIGGLWRGGGQASWEGRAGSWLRVWHEVVEGVRGSSAVLPHPHRHFCPHLCSALVHPLYRSHQPVCPPLTGTHAVCPALTGTHAQAVGEHNSQDAPLGRPSARSPYH